MTQVQKPGVAKKVFLAGATGVIGRSLAPLLVAAGHTVVGTTRKADQAAVLRAVGLRPVVVDVLDREAIFAALATEQPEVLIHELTDLGAQNLTANNRMRIEGTRNLVDAALAAGVRRIIAQSLAFAYAPGDGPAREGEPLDVGALAGRGQMVAGVVALENAVAEAPEQVVLRYGVLYGPGTWYAADGSVAERVRRGELAADESVTSFVHVDDAARAALLALDWPSGPVNIVDDEPAPATSWLPAYAAVLGAPAPRVVNGCERGARGASNAKARLQLGWSPRYPSWRDGFRTALG